MIEYRFHNGDPVKFPVEPEETRTIHCYINGICRATCATQYNTNLDVTLDSLNNDIEIKELEQEKTIIVDLNRWDEWELVGDAIDSDIGISQRLIANHFSFSETIARMFV